MKAPNDHKGLELFRQYKAHKKHIAMIPALIRAKYPEKSEAAQKALTILAQTALKGRLGIK